METLKLDLDIKDFNKVADIVSKRCGAVFMILNQTLPAGTVPIKLIGAGVFSTRKGYHIYLEVEGDYTSFDVCFLQMALGSDYKRECYNFARFRNNLSKDWNILFEKKFNEKGEVVSCEQAEKELSDILMIRINERMRC